MRKTQALYFLLSFGYSLNLVAQKQDMKLSRNIEEILSGFHKKVGGYVKNLKTLKTSSVSGDTIFLTASMIKMPILLVLFYKMERKELLYHQTLL